MTDDKTQPFRNAVMYLILLKDHMRKIGPAPEENHDNLQDDVDQIDVTIGMIEELMDIYNPIDSRPLDKNNGER